MHIIAIRPEKTGGNILARFDVQLDGMRMFNLALKQTSAGLRVFSPSAFGSAVVTFTPETSEALVALASGEIRHNDEHRTAA
ncbi:hypothetical protein ABK249_14480 [Neorhizobium sp. Rsf11]|uniref:Uncharacterized protein n=1 Tax=Neorhizobium phenanthreniclasticum TaxID=3157917 RepID=A0ABV0M5A8_9HYPH